MGSTTGRNRKKRKERSWGKRKGVYMDGGIDAWAAREERFSHPPRKRKKNGIPHLLGVGEGEDNRKQREQEANGKEDP